KFPSRKSPRRPLARPAPHLQRLLYRANRCSFFLLGGGKDHHRTFCPFCNLTVYPHADGHLFGANAIHTTHHAYPLIQVNQCDVVITPTIRTTTHYRSGINGTQPFGSLPT